MRNSDKKRLQYKVKTVAQAKTVAKNFLQSVELDKAVEFGLPEIDDRYHIWRIPIKSRSNDIVGEIVIDAITTLINEKNRPIKHCSNPACWAVKTNRLKDAESVQRQKFQV